MNNTVIFVALGVLLYLISKSSGETIAASSPATGGTCPGSPGCPGYVLPSSGETPVVTSTITFGDAVVNCPGSPGCPGDLGGLNAVWNV